MTTITTTNTNKEAQQQEPQPARQHNNDKENDNDDHGDNANTTRREDRPPAERVNVPVNTSHQPTAAQKSRAVTIHRLDQHEHAKQKRLRLALQPRITTRWKQYNKPAHQGGGPQAARRETDMPNKEDCLSAHTSPRPTQERHGIPSAPASPPSINTEAGLTAAECGEPDKRATSQHH